MKPTVNIIVAVASDNAIGRKGDLLFHIGADLRRFKELTMGHPIVMGRKTFESLPKGALPGRRNIVVSRNGVYSAPGAEVVDSLETAIEICADATEMFVIGGTQIYTLALPLADRLYLTRFDRTKDDADCFFPETDPSKWHTDERSEWFHNEKNNVNYCFETLSLIK